MALRNLSTPELIVVLRNMLEADQARILRVEGGLSEDFFPRIVTLIERLLPFVDGAGPAPTDHNTQRIALSKELAFTDRRHDRLLRGMYLLLGALAELTDDPALRDRYLSTRKTMFPRGLSMNNRSYIEQAGAAEQSEHAVGAAERAVLNTIVLPGESFPLGVTFDAWVSAGKHLRTLENQRLALGGPVLAETLSPAARLAARQAAARLLNAVVDVLHLDGAPHPEVVRVFLEPLAKLEDAADRRSEAEAAAVETKPPPVAPKV